MTKQMTWYSETNEPICKIDVDCDIILEETKENWELDEVPTEEQLPPGSAPPLILVTIMISLWMNQNHSQMMAMAPQ